MFTPYTPNYSVESQVTVAYDRALRRAFWSKVKNIIRQQSNRLLSYDAVRKCLQLGGQRDLGVQIVPVEQITGSVGRYNDFNREFMPTQEKTRQRWERIARAAFRGESLPPVELFKIGEDYFVEDGNHRVSVARVNGQIFIEAHVIEIDFRAGMAEDDKLEDTCACA